MWSCYCTDQIKVIVYNIHISYENLLICNDGKPSCIRIMLYKWYDVNYEMLTIAMIGNKIQGSASILNSGYVTEVYRSGMIWKAHSLVHNYYTWSNSLCIHVYLTTMLWARLSSLRGVGKWGHIHRVLSSPTVGEVVSKYHRVWFGSCDSSW